MGVKYHLFVTLYMHVHVCFPASENYIALIALYRPRFENPMLVMRQHVKAAAPETQFCAEDIMKQQLEVRSAALRGQFGYEGGKYFPTQTVCISVSRGGSDCCVDRSRVQPADRLDKFSFLYFIAHIDIFLFY